jgi:hypothetical protein
MPAANAHDWTFRSRFRAGAFGWRSDVPIKRIKEAVAEIKKATGKDKVLGAEGAVIFLEKVSGALEHVDSSSGAIGTAVNRAIETLVLIVAQAPASDKLRDKWLERLWCAIEDDDIPYIELRRGARRRKPCRPESGVDPCIVYHGVVQVPTNFWLLHDRELSGRVAARFLHRG